jgi:hypothetical protein
MSRFKSSRPLSQSHPHSSGSKCASPSINLTTVLRTTRAAFCAIRSWGDSLEGTLTKTSSRCRQVSGSYRGCRTRHPAREEWYHWPCTSHPRGFHLHHRSSYLHIALLRTCRASRQGPSGRRPSLFPNPGTDQSYDWFLFSMPRI